MVHSWDDGALYVFQGTIVNGGAISDVTARFTPGAGNEMELYWASISHNDATASTIIVLIRDPSANTLIELANIPLVTQNSVIQVPPVGTATAVDGNFPQFVRPIMISGTMDLLLQAIDIDDGEGITLSVVGRVSVGPPAFVSFGGGTQVETINTNRLF